MRRGEEGQGDDGKGMDLRDRSCLLRCSLLLKALLQNWHLYFLSGTSDPFLDAGVDKADVGRTATLAPGMVTERLRCCRRLVRDSEDGGDRTWRSPHRTIVEYRLALSFARTHVRSRARSRGI